MSTARPRAAFGLDLSGYAGGNSAFVRAVSETDGIIDVTIYRGHVFGIKLRGDRPARPVVEKEVEVLRACCRAASLYVDIPIDLQGLPCPGGEVFIWQLVKRPVDQAFDALPPLAERIGAPVARYKNLHRFLGDVDVQLGMNIFETYPAASLDLMNLPREKYKGQRAIFSSSGWYVPNEPDAPLGSIATGLRLVAEENETLDDHELDATICSITGVVGEEHVLSGKRLENEIARRVADTPVPVSSPRGYALLNSLPDSLSVRLSKKNITSHRDMLDEIRTAY